MENPDGLSPAYPDALPERHCMPGGPGYLSPVDFAELSMIASLADHYMQEISHTKQGDTPS